MGNSTTQQAQNLIHEEPEPDEALLKLVKLGISPALTFRGGWGTFKSCGETSQDFCQKVIIGFCCVFNGEMFFFLREFLKGGVSTTPLPARNTPRRLKATICVPTTLFRPGDPGSIIHS